MQIQDLQEVGQNIVKKIEFNFNLNKIKIQII